MHKPRYVKLLLTLATLVLARTLVAETFSNARDNFTITIPPDWESIPEPAIAEKTAAIPNAAPHAPYPAFHYAYQARSDRWFSFPYVSVRVDRSGRLAEDRLQSIAKLSSQIHDKAQSLGAGVLPKFQMNTAFYDPSTHIIWVTS